MTELIIFLIILFIAGGFAAVKDGLAVIKQTFIILFPIIEFGIKQEIKNYLSSPQFIFALIIFACSLFGIIFSATQKKIIWIIISSILNAISIVSFICNFSIIS